MLPLRLSEIAEMIGGKLAGTEDPLISGIAGIAEAGPGDLTFLAGAKFADQLKNSTAAAVIVDLEWECDLPAIRVERPYHAFAGLLGHVAPPVERLFPGGIHPTAVIDPTADVSAAAAIGPLCAIAAGVVIGAGTRLGPHVVVGPDVSIGEQCLLYANVTIREGCRLGNGVILHCGCNIGTDGFGFLPDGNGLLKIPQVGIVEIEDGAELGACVCVDRATTGKTVIGAGTKIDNLVQVAHNVRLGKSCALSGQAGVAGSTTVGNGVTVGGRVSISDHLVVGDGAKIAGGSGVTRNVEAGQTVFGYPALDFNEGFRMVAAMRRLPGLLRRVKELETALGALQDTQE